ncbi:MAG TPA: hypothetical protein VHL34_13115 [Rhizomicrobium sp.]|jgi:hypothetical protein|nr:hypothetical protein [Rhizomicrobium sp.]
MKALKRTASTLLSLAVVAMPAIASATCVNRDDMHALQAASLQQRLMVSAFQCKFLPQYNAFVIGHQPELQRYDAALLAFFKRDDPKGMATYNTYKTHLANIAALEDAHTNTFCAEVTILYQKTEGSAPLDPLLDTLPATDTAYASCVVPSGNAPVVAEIAPPPPSVMKAPEPAPVIAAPAPQPAPVVAVVTPPPQSVVKPPEPTPAPAPVAVTQAPPPAPAPAPVVASVAPPAPLEQPVAAPETPQAAPATQTAAAPPREKRAVVRALNWVGGIFGGGDESKTAPASPPPPAPSSPAAPAPAETSTPPAGTSAAADTPAPTRTAATFDPNTPLIQDGGDSTVQADMTRDERRAAKRKARREARRAAREQGQQLDDTENTDYDDSYDK